jgi:hypothetical protein
VGIRFPKALSNEILWNIICQYPIALQIQKRKGRWIGHILRKPEDIKEKEVLHWYPQGARRTGCTRRRWKLTVQEEALTVEKTWNKVKTLVVNREG